MRRKTPKYPSYQDYVIHDGTFIGEFENMYQDYEDPWFQTVKEQWASDKAIAINLMRKLKVKKVMELGCGLGYFTHEIAKTGVEVLGIDISQTAIRKARSTFPQCNFLVSDILNYSVYRSFKPDLIIMAEITWYILDKLDSLLSFLRLEFPDSYIIHLCVVHPPDVQKYGNDKFTTLQEMMVYFDMKYLEWGEIHTAEHNFTRTYFLGRWKKSAS